MKLLGLTLNHDAGLALYKGGSDFNIEDIFAINEERLNREKLTRSFPILSLNQAGVCNDVSSVKILISSSYTPIFLLSFINKTFSRQASSNEFSYLLNLYFTYQVLVRKVKLLEKIETFLLRNYYAYSLGYKSSDVKLLDHHHCHAAGAYYTSGFSDALVVTIDSLGDGLTLTVSLGERGDMVLIKSQNGFSGISCFYSRITQILGFKPLMHEGKVTGLAACGKIIDDLLEKMKEIFVFDASKNVFTEVKYLRDFRRSKNLYNSFKQFRKEDVAATAQRHLEDEVVKFIKHWANKTGKKNICLAGGLFANVKLNQSIHELKEIDNIFIFPHMGDGGLGLGAILAEVKPAPVKLKSIFFGPSFSDEDIKKELEQSGLDFKRVDDIEKNVAEFLADGKIVARFNGCMEFGPRALGNRSILYQATDKSVNDWLNARLNRTEFMPFAPVTLFEYADKCYKNIKGADHAAKFMTITFNCTEWMKEVSPAVIHVDGTARPQLIARDDGNSMYNVLKKYHEFTGIPSIINTSFNMHGEPIVNTPKEAIRSFLQGKLDCLAIGNYIVINK